MSTVLSHFRSVSSSSAAIKEKWYPEVHHYIPTVPVLLCGTKVDCRETKQVDPNLGRFDPVTPEMGRSMAQEISAAQYLEISAKTRQGLVQLFQEAINTVVVARGLASGKSHTKANGPGGGGGKKKNCALL